MKSLQYKLIALDIDGTLLTDDHVILPEVKEAVQAAQQAGAQIVLCTGRGSGAAIPILFDLGLKGYLITHNGAATIDAESKKVIIDFPMADEQLMPYIQYCKQHQIHYDISTAFEIMYETATDEVKEMYVKFMENPVQFNSEEKLPDRVLKFTIFASEEQLNQVELDWTSNEFSLKFVRSGDFFIDVQNNESSKGNALAAFAQKNNIPREQILAIGNYYNDITMLQYAGLGIAMGNSPDEVKDAADVVGPSNQEAGVATLLKQYAWA